MNHARRKHRHTPEIDDLELPSVPSACALRFNTSSAKGVRECEPVHVKKKSKLERRGSTKKSSWQREKSSIVQPPRPHNRDDKRRSHGSSYHYKQQNHSLHTDVNMARMGQSASHSFRHHRQRSDGFTRYESQDLQHGRPYDPHFQSRQYAHSQPSHERMHREINRYGNSNLDTYDQHFQSRQYAHSQPPQKRMHGEMTRRGNRNLATTEMGKWGGSREQQNSAKRHLDKYDARQRYGTNPNAKSFTPSFYK